MNLDFRFYWAMLLRRLPVMILFVLLFSGVGIVAALQLPNVYSTSARLLVEEPLIPDEMVSSTVRISAVEQLAIIEQRLLTRANLIDIANRFTVFEDLNQMERDNVVSAMRRATKISRTRGARTNDRATLMIISFEARTAQIAADVVNEYVTLVLQENARFRTARAENTLEFFQQEVQQLDNDLDTQSAAIALFKAENANALPQDQTYRLGRRSLLQERLGILERDLNALDQRRERLLRTFETTGRLATRATDEQLTSYEQQLIVRKAELDNLLKSYSDENPRVIRLQRQIDRLEAIVAAQNAVATQEVDDTETSPEQVMLDASLADIDSEAEAIQTAIDNTTEELEALLENIAQSTANAIQLAELERDYEITQTRYSTAVSNLNSARMSERLESTAQGQRITVIENASVPRVPSGPDRVIIAAASIIVGTGLAVGYFFLLEFLNRVIRRPAEMMERFDTEPITVIPYMESRGEKVMRRGGMIVTTLAVLVAVPAGLWYVDTNYMPLEVIVQRGLDKIGLG